MADLSPDVFDQLLAAKWRDVEFPVTRTKMSIAHDLAEHKSWGVDGARVESTGLAPLRFSFSSPLLNGISPGRNERWAALYPNQMRALIAAFQQKSRGVLTHPEFGPILCKAERLDLDWDAARRGGVDAELTFVETTIDNDRSFLLEPTPVQGVEVSIEELDSDSFKADLKTLLLRAGVDLPPYLQDGNKVSLTDFMRQVKSVTDYPSVLSYRSAGQIDSIVYHAKQIQQSVEKAGSALTWPATNNVEKIKANAFELKEKLIAGTKDIAFFTVPAATTLAGVCRQLPEAKVGDLIKLNPALMRGPEIEQGTVVRYYKPAA